MPSSTHRKTVRWNCLSRTKVPRQCWRYTIRELEFPTVRCHIFVNAFTVRTRPGRDIQAALDWGSLSSNRSAQHKAESYRFSAKKEKAPECALKCLGPTAGSRRRAKTHRGNTFVWDAD